MLARSIDANGRLPMGAFYIGRAVENLIKTKDDLLRVVPSGIDAKAATDLARFSVEEAIEHAACALGVENGVDEAIIRKERDILVGRNDQGDDPATRDPYDEVSPSNHYRNMLAAIRERLVMDVKEKMERDGVESITFRVPQKDGSVPGGIRVPLYNKTGSAIVEGCVENVFLKDGEAWVCVDHYPKTRKLADLHVGLTDFYAILAIHEAVIPRFRYASVGSGRKSREIRLPASLKAGFHRFSNQTIFV